MVGTPTNVELAYGDATVRLAIPHAFHVEGLRRPAPPERRDALAVVADALDQPIDARPLSDAARGRGTVTIVVPDPTRPTPSPTILHPILARLAKAGIGPERIRVVVARGIHAVAAREEVERVVGADVMRALRPVQSAPDLPEWNDPIGTDDELGEVRVHRLVANAGLVVLVGEARPHHLAGFGGGPKALVPGTADRASVLAAHRLTLRTWVAPDGSLTPIEGVWGPNPFREALLRVARGFGRCWLLNLVLDGEQRVLAAAAGEVGAAHAKAAEAWRALCAPRPSEPADAVLVGVRGPRAADLIQAHKALRTAAALARPGAPILWLARAGGGVGHPEFLPWFESGRLERHLAALRQTFHPYGLTAYALRRTARDHPVHVVSEVDADVLRGMGLLPASAPQVGLERVLAAALGPRLLCLEAA